jgi:uncharacterized zinc-type alcohol dehydrogenase-like protein
LPNEAQSPDGKTLGWAVHEGKGKFSAWRFDRRPVGDKDVFITITYCGICRSDIHQIEEDWGPGNFPMVPG